jgi:hypothetical protein
MTFKFLKMVLTTCRYAMCISLGVLSVSGTASATLIDSIAGLDEGAMYRVLFVTSTKTDATSSDIDYYNTFVSTAADTGSVTGSLGLSWKALASTSSVNAQDNTGIMNSDSAPVTLFNTFGDIIAFSGKDFWGGLLTSGINYDEDRTFASEIVWTGTDADGSTNLPLGTSTLYSSYGSSNCLDSCLFNFGTNPWDRGDLFSVFGASAVVVKPSTDVPEPGTVILLSLGLAGLSFARYRRQS